MVQRVSIQFVDDLDGESEASRTVTFALGACQYEIDLSDKHVAEMRLVWQPYMDAARRTG